MSDVGDGDQVAVPFQMTRDQRRRIGGLQEGFQGPRRAAAQESAAFG